MTTNLTLTATSATTAGVLYTETNALFTSEDGDSATFKAELTAAPRYNVMLMLSINDASEGLFQATGSATNTLTFTIDNWNVPQTVSLIGVDDNLLDGDIPFVVQTQVSSNDLRYDYFFSNIPTPNIIVINNDNDFPDELFGDADNVPTADLLYGGNGASEIYGLSGRDEIYGGNGNDRLYGGADDDILYGEADNDELEGAEGNDELNGGTGDDTLTGGAGKDTLIGGEGNDILDGMNDDDSMDGGNGSDDYYVDSASDIAVDSGTDNAVDTVWVTDFLANGYTLGSGIDNAVLFDTAAGTSLTGNESNNELYGNASDNVINGGAGNDTLHGSSGMDELLGGDGSDRLEGDAGADLLFGGAGDDILIGCTGDDEIEAGEGDDLIIGGKKVILFPSNPSNDFLIGGKSTASLFDGFGDDILIGGEGTDSLFDGFGDDILLGCAGDDEIEADDGDDKYTGGEGVDTVKYSSAVAAINVNLLTGTATGTDIGTDTLIQIENVIGGKGDDTLTGNNAANNLDGDSGSDHLIGGAGNDTYHVRQTGDVVTELVKSGTDTVYSYLPAHTLAVNVEVGHIMNTGAANLTGNGIANTLFAGKGNNVLNGGAGIDTVSYQYGQTGSKGITASLASTAFQTTGGSGSDKLIGIENLTGSDKADKLTGNTNKNVLTGGMGKDVLKGNGGNDTFDFNALNEMGSTSATADVISDFNLGDKIDLSTLDANTSLTGNNAFAATFVNNFSAAGQLKFSNGVLYGNTDTDLDAEFAIVLTGVITLMASDIVL